MTETMRTGDAGQLHEMWKPDHDRNDLTHIGCACFIALSLCGRYRPDAKLDRVVTSDAPGICRDCSQIWDGGFVCVRCGCSKRGNCRSCAKALRGAD